jgi:hypothetical protein
MTIQRGEAILAVWTDIAPEAEDEFNEWYNTEHIPQLLGVPGFLHGRRDRAVEGKPRYLALYELSDVNVLKSDAFRQVREEGRTAWTQKMLPHFRNTTTGAYRQIFSHGTPPNKEAEVVLSVQLNIPADKETEFNEWYNVDHVPALVGVPGVFCARRYVAVDGDPKYLAMYELSDAKILGSPEWEQARNSEWTVRMRPHLLDAKIRVGRCLFPQGGCHENRRV